MKGPYFPYPRFLDKVFMIWILFTIQSILLKISYLYH